MLKKQILEEIKKVEEVINRKTAEIEKLNKELEEGHTKDDSQIVIFKLNKNLDELKVSYQFICNLFDIYKGIDDKK